MGWVMLSLVNKDTAIIPQNFKQFPSLSRAYGDIYSFLVELYRLYGPTEPINATNEYLGKMTRYSGKTVSLAIKELEKQGFIDIEYRKQGYQDRIIWVKPTKYYEN